MDVERIPPEILAEQWFSFLQRAIGTMQAAYRASGVNQKTVAKRLGKKPSFISRCFSGQTNMTLRTIHDLTRAMNCRLEIIVQPLAALAPVNRKPLPARREPDTSTTIDGGSFPKDGSTGTSGKPQLNYAD
jgi:DNA-binding phage protein